MRFVMLIHNDPATFDWWEGLSREGREPWPPAVPSRSVMMTSGARR